MLCSGNSLLGEVEIKQGIFQEHSLSPLVLILALIPLSLILRKTKTAYAGWPVIFSNSNFRRI